MGSSRQKALAKPASPITFAQRFDVSGKYSATGTRTRVARVRAEYPNQLDYSGSVGQSLEVARSPKPKITLATEVARRMCQASDARQFSSCSWGGWGCKKKLFTLLDLCVSSLRRGHANLLCIVPILTDDPRRESETCLSSPGPAHCEHRRMHVHHT